VRIGESSATEALDAGGGTVDPTNRKEGGKVGTDEVQSQHEKGRMEGNQGKVIK